MIYGTNLLARCPVLVPVFCCPFVSEKLFREVSRNQLKIYGNYFYMETKTELEGGIQGAQPPDASQARPRAWPCLGPTWTGGPPPRVALSPINCPRRKNPRYPIIFSRRRPRPPPSQALVREGSATLPGTLPERGIDTGGIYTTMPASGVMRE